MICKAVLFDLDGTLLDTLPDLRDALNFALTGVGRCPVSSDQTRARIGNGVRKLIERSLPPSCPESEFERALGLFREYYSSHLYVHTRPYTGAQKLLTALHAQGVRTAIVTNKYETAAESLRRRFFPGTAEFAIGDVEGRRRKPEPDGVFEALRRLGVEPKDAVYVGDTEVDMQTARNAGVRFMAAAWGYRSPEALDAAGVTDPVRSPKELGKRLGLKL